MRFRLPASVRRLVMRVLASMGFGGGDGPGDPGVRVLAPMGFGGDDRPADPRAGVRVPRNSRPGGRSSAVAVLEPDDLPRAVSAISRRIR